MIRSWLNAIFHTTSTYGVTLLQKIDLPAGFSPAVLRLLPLSGNCFVDINQYISFLETASVNPTLEEQLYQYDVIKLEHVKEVPTWINSTEYDLLVATVLDRSSGKGARLLVQRAEQPEDAEVPDDVKVISSSPKPSNQSSSRFLSNNAPAYPMPTNIDTPSPSNNIPSSPLLPARLDLYSPSYALDGVLTINESRPPTNLAVRRIFRPDPQSLPLLHFAMILLAVHRHAPKYSTHKSQSYWFALIVMGASMFQGGVTWVPSSNGDIPDVGSPLEWPNLAKVPISKPDPTHKEFQDFLISLIPAEDRTIIFGGAPTKTNAKSHITGNPLEVIVSIAKEALHLYTDRLAKLSAAKAEREHNE